MVVHQTYTSDLVLEEDAYTKTYADLEIAYDFWSLDGVPFISFLNVTDEDILLDMSKSTISKGRRNRSESLEDVLRDQTDIGSYLDQYPDLNFRREHGTLVLVLKPDTWASIYGPSCHSYRGNSREKAQLIFNYAYTHEGETTEISNEFEIVPFSRLSRKEISSYERTDAGPDQYYIDKSANINSNDALIFLDIFATILLII